MNYTKTSFGLGLFSIALGAIELMASRRIATALDVEAHEGVIKAFGVREIAAGVALLQAPAHSARMWNRVAGDALDMAALGYAARRSPRNQAVWGAIAFVAGAAAIDALVARGLDRSTGAVVPDTSADPLPA